MLFDVVPKPTVALEDDLNGVDGVGIEVECADVFVLDHDPRVTVDALVCDGIREPFHCISLALSIAMSLALIVEKAKDTEDACVYDFGAPEETAGRVRLQKSSGDVEVLALSDSTTGANPRFLLAHLVPRLHDYHDRGTYPDRDQWTI